MHEIGTWSFTLAILVTLLLLALGIVQIGTYWTNKPDKDQSLVEIRTLESDYRSIVVPALAAMVTGLLISLSASFLFIEFTEGKQYPLPIGVLLFLSACITFFLMLKPIIKGRPKLEELALYPQRILVTATGITGLEHDADATLHVLRNRLQTWKNRHGAFSLGMTNLAVSPNLNTAFEAVPASWALTLGKAVRALWWRGGYIAAWRTAPWRFGWTLYLNLLLILVGAVSYIYSGESLSGVFRLILTIGLTTSLGIFVHWTGVLLGATRRLSIERHFLLPCELELDNAGRRVAQVLERDQGWSGMPARITALEGELKRTQWVAAGGAVISFLAPVVALALRPRRR